MKKAKKLNEESYKNNANIATYLCDAYFLTSHTLAILARMYKNMHLNFDGNHIVDTMFEDFYKQIEDASFTVMHRTKIVDNNTIMPIDFATSSEKYQQPCVLSQYLQQITTENTSIYNSTQEVLKFFISIENIVLEFLIELNEMIVGKYDIAGSNLLAELVDANELRIVDLNGALNHENE